jgi:hypothetical protein
MQQRRGMDEFHHCRQIMVILAGIAESLRGQEHQRGAQALATAVDDVFTDLVDQNHLGVQTGADHRIHRRHVRRE